MQCSTCLCPLPAPGTLCPCGKAAYCSVECQRKDWRAHKPLCPPYKVTKVQGRGRGLAATRALPAGALLLAELPLMAIDSEDSEVITAVFKGEFEQLGPEVRATVLQLFDPVRDGVKRELLEEISEVEAVVGKEGELARRLGELAVGIVGEAKEADEGEDDVVRAQRIFAANSMQVCEVAALYSPTEGALYNHISLLNHSCNPNAVWSWTKGEFRRKVVRAVKAIGKGEEILVNYVDVEDFNYGSREARQRVLAERFAFFCRCSECGLEGEALRENEEQRAEVVAGLARVKELMAEHEERATVAALQAGAAAVGRVAQLGLGLELPRILLNMYQVATAARYQNILGAANPALFRERALGLCSQLGDSFMHFFNFVCLPD